jgi:hypothetical protein
MKEDDNPREKVIRSRLDIALRNAGEDLKAQARAIIAYKAICAPFAVQWAQRQLEPKSKKKGR